MKRVESGPEDAPGRAQESTEGSVGTSELNPLGHAQEMCVDRRCAWKGRCWRCLWSRANLEWGPLRHTDARGQVVVTRDMDCAGEQFTMPHHERNASKGVPASRENFRLSRKCCLELSVYQGQTKKKRDGGRERWAWRVAPGGDRSVARSRVGQVRLAGGLVSASEVGVVSSSVAGAPQISVSVVRAERKPEEPMPEEV